MIALFNDFFFVRIRKISVKQPCKIIKFKGHVKYDQFDGFHYRSQLLPSSHCIIALHMECDQRRRQKLVSKDDND